MTGPVLWLMSFQGCGPLPGFVFSFTGEGVFVSVELRGVQMSFGDEIGNECFRRLASYTKAVVVLSLAVGVVSSFAIQKILSDANQRQVKREQLEKEYERGFEAGRKSVFSEMRESGNLEPVPRIPAE